MRIKKCTQSSASTVGWNYGWETWGYEGWLDIYWKKNTAYRTYTFQPLLFEYHLHFHSHSASSFSNFNVQKNNLRIFIKYQVWFSKSWLGPEILLFLQGPAWHKCCWFTSSFEAPFHRFLLFAPEVSEAEGLTHRHRWDLTESKVHIETVWKEAGDKVIETY